MKSASYKIILIFFLAFSCYKVSAQAKVTDPHAGHGSHAGNSASAASKSTTTAATKKYQQINDNCLLYTSPSPRDGLLSRMPSSA